jgi:hypothetical protein
MVVVKFYDTDLLKDTSNIRTLHQLWNIIKSRHSIFHPFKKTQNSNGSRV